MSAEQLWSSETQIAYKRHFCDMFFYLNKFNFEPNQNSIINILLEGEEFRQQLNIRLDGEEGEITDDFCDFIINQGNKFVYSYFIKYKNEFPFDVELFNQEHDFIMELFDIISEVIKSKKDRNDLNNESQRRRFGRRWHIHPINQLRDTNGFYINILIELKNFPEKFYQYTRMSVHQFNFLLDLVKPKIEKCNLYRKTIPPEIRLLVTLRHLATGEEQTNIAVDYLVGKSTIQEIIPETCQAIYDVLQPLYIQWPSDLEKVSSEFDNLHKFPNCCGAVDGKHIRIQKPANSGGKYYNYKKFHSIVLMAVCDANANFTYADIGGFGSQSDGNIFAYSALGRALYNNEIDWPEDKQLPNSNTMFNYFLIGDEAFPISKHFLRPYSGRNLSDDKEFFNHRLSSARNTIERAFGILVNRFRIFKGEIIGSTTYAENIVKAAITLHNFIRMTSDADTPIVSSVYINEAAAAECHARGRPSIEGTTVRDIYKDYLFSLT